MSIKLKNTAVYNIYNREYPHIQNKTYKTKTRRKMQEKKKYYT